MVAPRCRSGTQSGGRASSARPPCSVAVFVFFSGSVRRSAQVCGRKLFESTGASGVGVPDCGKRATPSRGARKRRGPQINVFACWRPSLVCGAARLSISPKTRSRVALATAANVRLGPGLVGSREGFARLDKAAACLPVLRRAQCFRRASEPSQAPERSPQRRLGPLHGRFKLKTRFCGA